MASSGQGTITARKGVKGTSYQAKARAHGLNHSKTFHTRKEAVAWIQDINSRVRKGDAVDHTQIRKIMLGEIFSEYLRIEKITDKNQISRIDKLTREIGSVPLGKFDSKGFRKLLDIWLNETIPDVKNKKKPSSLYRGYQEEDKNGILVARQYAPATIRKLYYELKKILSWHSTQFDYTFDTKPFKDCKPPAAWSKHRDRRLNEPELDRLCQSCFRMRANQKALKDIIRFQQYSCMRIGETLKMEWSQIRLNQSLPSASYIFVPKEHQKTREESSVEDRYVSMRPELYSLIINELLPSKTTNSVVFPQWKDGSALSHVFKRLCKQANIEDFVIHDLRHEAISWLFENTALTDIEISKISGHIQMDTLKKYANLRPSKTGLKLWANN